jgi:hypothetical protein
MGRVRGMHGTDKYTYAFGKKKRLGEKINILLKQLYCASVGK